jgi:exosortase
MPGDYDRLYLLVFLSTAVALALLERVRPLRRQPVSIATRWTSNIGLYLIGSIVAAIVLPIGIYAFAHDRPPGPVSGLDIPLVAQVALTFLLLDLWKYWEHRAFHKIPLLWRAHLVHHTDTQVDVTTTERHHPLEVMAGALILVAVVAALGLPAPALGIYLLTATVVALWSHANVRLPTALDRPLRRLIVTPSVHATHHSDLRAETDSNFGSVLTIWDRLFGTYFDPERARIPHFGLDHFHRPTDTRLGRVLQQPFLYRRDLPYPARDAEAAEAAPARRTVPFSGFSLKTGGHAALLGGAVGCVLVALAMGSAAVDMTATWRSSEAYQYAWLVLPMVVYILGWHWDYALRPVDVSPDFSGVLVVIVAAVCWAAATLMNIDAGRQFALVLAFQGVAMATVGWRSYWRLFPALAMLFLMIPAGDLLQPALRALTVKAIDLFAASAGLPHAVDGFVIFIGAQRYVVVDECSGLAYVTLASFLGYSFGLLLYRSFPKVVAMSLLGAALGIVSNVLRVCSIVLVDWLRGSQMDLTAHGTLQWIGLLVGLGVLFYILLRLDPDAAPTAPLAAAREPEKPARKWAPVAAGLAGLLVAGGAAALQRHDSALPEWTPPDVSPPAIRGWVRAEAPSSWSIHRDGSTASVNLAYDRDGRRIQVVIVETLSSNAKLPESRLLLDDSDRWREHRAERERGCAGDACLVFRHSTWRREKEQRARHLYFAYGIGAFTTDSLLALRAMHGWQRLTGAGDRPRLIGFISEAEKLDVDELAAAYGVLDAAIEASSRSR